MTIVGQVKESDEQLEKIVRQQLQQWFPSTDVNQWKFLRMYRVAYAQPAQSPSDPNKATSSKSARIIENIFCCGDHRDSATLNGAISSGKRAAAEIVAAINAAVDRNQ